MPRSPGSLFVPASVVLAAFAVVACGSSQPAPSGITPATEAAAGGEDASAPATKLPDEAGAPFTAAECQAAGGEVVGDIGDGAIHRPGYRCPKSGEAPLGPVRAEAGGPLAIEGAVCCK